jgi:hypothetical protein
MEISFSRLIVGIVFILGSVVLTIASFYSSFVFLVYSFLLLFIGIWVLFNKGEDKIEERKDLNKIKVKS